MKNRIYDNIELLYQYELLTQEDDSTLHVYVIPYAYGKKMIGMPHDHRITDVKKYIIGCIR